MPLPPALQERLKKRGIIKKSKEDPEEKPSQSVSVCPNKANPYHECSDYCIKRWSGAKVPPQEKVILPPNWKKVIDEKTNHPYFWNVKTGEVSWSLPPGCTSVTSTTKSSESKASEGEEKKNSKLVERPKKDKPRPSPYTKPRKRGYKPSEDDELDPMDPAAYSDTPRGNWSSGLDRRGEAKTGVDVTANGPLFQMRPYPSPGDILRANKKMKEDS